MKNIDYNKVLASERYDYPYIFEDNIGLNIPIPDSFTIVKSWDWKNEGKIRRVLISLSTFTGISFGAKHWYAKIEIDGVEINKPNNVPCPEELKNNPLLNWKYYMKLYRPLTKEDLEEKDEFNNFRFEPLDYEEGDYVQNFNSVKDILDFAIEVFKERFRGNWEFRFNGLNTFKEKVLGVMKNNTFILNESEYNYFLK